MRVDKQSVGIKNMSVKVLFCDNDKYMLEIYKNLLLYVAEKYQVKMEIELYQNESELLFLMEDKDIHTWDLLILNSNLKMNDGIEVVKILMKNGCTAEVLFLGSDIAKAIESFSVGPFYYFIQERTTISEFEKVIVDCLEVIKDKRSNMITISGPKKERRLKLDEIEYFKVNHRIISVYSDGEMIGNFYGNLHEIEEKLQGKKFVRTYRSYIVNVEAIDVIKSMELVTFSNAVIPVGRKYKKQLLNEIRQYGDIDCLGLTKKKGDDDMDEIDREEKVVRKVANKKGFTIPTALAFTILLMALAGSILLVATYRYQRMHIRNQESQLYLYATALVEEHTNGINTGGLNQTVAETVNKAKETGAASLSEYAKSYTFDMGLGINGDEKLVNSHNNQEVGYEMIVTYEPISGGQVLPGETKDYIKIGDRMKIEYRISQGNIEYRITADYYCAKNSNLDAAGMPVPPVERESFTNMKWELNQYTGKFYTEK